ncbi:hypothetical protein SESBI_49575 [Sesbania bispinosa]|nr:hypothetical protein SESBI_49575 [Sesbania bispinosa]
MAQFLKKSLVAVEKAFSGANTIKSSTSRFEHCDTLSIESKHAENLQNGTYGVRMRGTSSGFKKLVLTPCYARVNN